MGASEAERLRVQPANQPTSKIIGTIRGLLEFGAEQAFTPPPKKLTGLQAVLAQADQPSASVPITAKDMVAKCTDPFQADVEATITDVLPTKPNPVTVAQEQERKARGAISDPLQLPPLDHAKPGTFGTFEGTIRGHLGQQLANAMLSTTIESVLEQISEVGCLAPMALSYECGPAEE